MDPALRSAAFAAVCMFGATVVSVAGPSGPIGGRLSAAVTGVLFLLGMFFWLALPELAETETEGSA